MEPSGQLISDVHRFRSDGFLVKRGLLNAAIIEQFVETAWPVFSRLARHYNLPLSSTIEGDMIALFRHNAQAYFSAVRVVGQLVSLLDIFRDDAIARLVCGLGVQVPCFNTGAVMHIMSNELRPQEGYLGLGVHQDFPSTQASLNALIVWIPFTPANADFFPIEVLPGSHLRGILPGEQRSHVFEVLPSAYRETDFVAISVEPGDVLVMSVFAAHRSGQSGKKGVRVAASMRYEDASEGTYIARCYPNAYKRTVERQIMIPGFPSERDLHDLFHRSEQS